jgi:hypothetical protein
MVADGKGRSRLLGTIVVLLILVGLWAAVLIPPALRARAEGTPADSIISFHRQLRVLQRSGPPGSEPASTPPTMPTRAVSGGGGSGSRHGVAHHRVSMGRIQAQKRRRQVVAGLLVAMGVTFLLGFIGPLRIMWLLHFVLDCLFGVYVALLIRRRNTIAEREMKLRFLPRAPRVAPTAAAAIAPESSMLLRRSGS